MAKDTRFKKGDLTPHKLRKEKELRRKENIANLLSNIPTDKSHIIPFVTPLAEKALDGDKQAFDELKAMGVLDVSPETTTDTDSLKRRPIGNDNLPPACRSLREALDIDIAVIVQRYEMGLPSSEAEQLLAKTSLAVRDSGLKGRAAQRGERIAKAWREAWEGGTFDQK